MPREQMTAATVDGQSVNVPYGRVTQAQLDGIGSQPNHVMEDLAAFALLTVFASNDGVCAEPSSVIVTAVLGMSRPTWEKCLKRLVDVEALKWSPQRSCWQVVRWASREEQKSEWHAWFTLPSLALCTALSRPDPTALGSVCRSAPRAVGTYVLAVLRRNKATGMTYRAVTYDDLTSVLAIRPTDKTIQRAMATLKKSPEGIAAPCLTTRAYQYGRTVEGVREKVMIGQNITVTRLINDVEAVAAGVGWATTRTLPELRQAILDASPRS